MTRKSGINNWPPRWTTLPSRSDATPVGAVGILEQVLMSDLFDKKVFLFMRYDGRRFTGSFHFDDAQFAYTVYTLMKQRLGRSMEEIGDLDVSFTL